MAMGHRHLRGRASAQVLPAVPPDTARQKATGDNRHPSLLIVAGQARNGGESWARQDYVRAERDLVDPPPIRDDMHADTTTCASTGQSPFLRASRGGAGVCADGDIIAGIRRRAAHAHDQFLSTG